MIARTTAPQSIRPVPGHLRDGTSHPACIRPTLFPQHTARPASANSPGTQASSYKTYALSLQMIRTRNSKAQRVAYLRFGAALGSRSSRNGILGRLHSVVIRTTPALRRNPRDDLIWILNVAGLAVHAVGRIQTDAFAVRLAGIIDHLIHVRRTEILAWAAEFLHATRIAHVRVMDHQVRRLIFLVLRARVIKVGKLIERQL